VNRDVNIKRVNASKGNWIEKALGLDRRVHRRSEKGGSVNVWKTTSKRSGGTNDPVDCRGKKQVGKIDPDEET